MRAHAVLVVGMLGVCAPAAAQQAASPTARQIVERYIAARGGLEKIKAVRQVNDDLRPAVGHDRL